MTLTLLGLNMVKYLVGTERAKAHACSDTLRQGESRKVFRPWSAGPPRTHTSLRVSILPPECRLCGTTNWTAFVCKRLSRRPLDMIRAGPALGKHGHTSKCTTQSPDRPLEAAVEALVIAYCFFTGDGSYPSPFHAGGTPDARKQKKTVTYSFRVLTVALASVFFQYSFGEWSWKDAQCHKTLT